MLKYFRGPSCNVNRVTITVSLNLQSQCPRTEMCTDITQIEVIKLKDHTLKGRKKNGMYPPNTLATNY